jgi:lipoprotein-releasing system permease protein
MMFRPSYELFIARRYLKSRNKTGFINLITYISILGVAIGVAALIIVLSVMNGFESEVRSRIIGFDTHIRLRTYHDQGIDDYTEIMGRIRSIPHIIGMSPYILDKGMIRAGDRNDGVIVRGAEQKTVGDVSDLHKNIIYGRLELGMVETGEGERHLPGIVVGRFLADRLMIDIGDKVVLVSPTGVHSMFQMPPVKQFVVTGFFESGMYEYDNAYVYISLESAQELFRMGKRVSGIEIRLDDLYKASQVVEGIDKRLGFPYYALTWFDMRKNLFSWMQLEKWAMFIILCLIILVAAFNIISTLIMVVMEKTKEIGILKSMGATARSIMRIFLYEGIVVGVVGTFFGLVIGFGLCFWQENGDKIILPLINKPLPTIKLPGDVYFISILPVKMQVSDFVSIGIAAILICLLAAIYPARKASKLDPVEAIRYE